MKGTQSPLGDFHVEDNDLAPTEGRKGTVRRVKSINALTSVVKELRRPKLVVARASTLRTESEAEQAINELYGDWVDIDIPQTPNYNVDTEDPERDARNRIPVANAIDIDQETVDGFQTDVNVVQEKLVASILKHVIAPAMATMNAAAVSQAVMRDGLGVDMVVDSNIWVVLRNIGTLKIVAEHAETLPDPIRQTFMRDLAKGFAANSLEDYRKGGSANYSAILDALRGYVEGEDNTNMAQSPIGVRKVRTPKE